MAQIPESERIKRANQKGASQYRYLSNDQLRKKRADALHFARNRSAQVNKLLREGATRDSVDVADLIYDMRRALGIIGRCTTILRDRWEE